MLRKYTARQGEGGGSGVTLIGGEITVIGGYLLMYLYILIGKDNYDSQ